MTTLVSPDVCVRPEHPGDSDSVRHVNVLAFGRAAEADLVDSLRAMGTVTLSAVALLGATIPGGAHQAAASRGDLCIGDTHGGEIIGHVFFTPTSVTAGNREVPLLSLTSVAVLPEHQRKGIGTMLVSSCLEYLRTRGHIGVVVLGDSGFYRRFGFIQADRWGLEAELEVPDESFLALSLTPGALGGISGLVHYAPEFASVAGRR